MRSSGGDMSDEAIMIRFIAYCRTPPDWFAARYLDTVEAANVKTKKDNPALAIYDSPQLTERETQDKRLTAWENRMWGLKSVAPGVHARERAAFIKQAGIR
jgi:hypothetical protein